MEVGVGVGIVIGGWWSEVELGEGWRFQDLIWLSSGSHARKEPCGLWMRRMIDWLIRTLSAESPRSALGEAGL